MEEARDAAAPVTDDSAAVIDEALEEREDATAAASLETEDALDSAAEPVEAATEIAEEMAPAASEVSEDITLVCPCRNC
jgi:hypothetical protein